jgi:hypothetical protein
MLYTRPESRNSAMEHDMCKMHTPDSPARVYWITISNQSTRSQLCKIMERKDFAPLISCEQFDTEKTSPESASELPLGARIPINSRCSPYIRSSSWFDAFLSELYTKLRRARKKRAHTHKNFIQEAHTTSMRCSQAYSSANNMYNKSEHAQLLHTTLCTLCNSNSA